ncbi:MAG: extracellular solute-binding protein [Candidatus Aphodomonas sp.]|nr:extracellular solute-binding protein [Candidatus Aphodomonas sp.]
MKKLFALLLAAVMVFACAGMAAAEDITLDVIICQYGPNTNDWFLGTGMNGTSFVEKFEAENPGIKLNLEVISWNDVHTVVSTRISNNNAPDILNIDSFTEYVTPDQLLLPVKDYCPEELYNDFFPSFIAESVIDDTVWAVPDLASARALYYNADILDEVGIEVPETWADLEDACQAIIDFYGGDVYPWGIDMTTDEGQAAFAYYIWGNNGGFVDAEGSLKLDSAENIEALEFAIGLYNKGYTNPNPATQTRYDLQDMFGAGKMAMVIGPNSIPTYIADKGYTDVNYGTAAIPHNEGATSSSAGVMDRIMAFRDDAYPDQAARNEAIGKFLTFFYAPENYVGWVTMEGFLPAVNSAVAAMVEADPTFEAWLDVLNTAKFYPTTNPSWNDARVALIKAEQNALLGGNVAELLAEAQASFAK